MGYQALLFCPDEKLAKVASQVFSDLDFSIDPVHEPFAAVKKLMAQRYDAVVVDCENEQNASLLLKSARNSSHNQSSLAIALVEGQAGVAKAYRIGANLVLTKPINVEQAKGTLRVARGLLRKSSDGAAATASAAPVHSAQKPPVHSAPVPSESGPITHPVPAVIRHDVSELEAPVSSTSVLPAMAACTQIEKEPETILPAATASESASVPESVSEVPQPRKSPMDDIVKNDAIHPPAVAFASSTAVSAPAQAKSSPFVSVPGSAAAVAPAKEVSTSPAKQAPEGAQAKSSSVAPAAPEPSAQLTASESAGASEAPSFGSFGEGEVKSGSSRNFVIGIVVLLMVAIAGYVGYEQYSKSQKASPSTAPASMPQNSDEPAPKLAPMSAPASAPSAPTADRASVATTDSNAAAVAPTDKSASGGTPVIRLSAAPEIETRKPATPIVVKANSGSPKAQPQGEESAPVLPSTVASANDAGLSGLISSTSTAVARPSLSTVRVSQGVSQGLVIKRVQPKYPQAALATHAHGAVQIEAKIDKEGNVSNLRVVSGDPVLAKAATEAVRQWRYKPYYLDGEPVEIETQITVNFKAD